MDVLVTDVTDTSASLSWTEPTYNGGRTDGFFYIIGYSSPGGLLNYYPTTSPVTYTNATVPGLSPMTMYTFVVVAGNKVTMAFPDVFTLPDPSRTSDETINSTKASRE